MNRSVKSGRQGKHPDDSLDRYIATQIKIFREQQGMSQRELAKKVGMTQPRIAVLEDTHYSSWSINTLRRLANAFDLKLSIRFEPPTSLASDAPPATAAVKETNGDSLFPLTLFG